MSTFTTDFGVQKDFTFDHTSTNKTDNVPSYNNGFLPLSANQGDIAFEKGLSTPNLDGKLKYFDGTVWKDLGGTVTVGPINPISTPNGADITSGVLRLHAASITNGGVVTTDQQQFSGSKTFVNSVFITDPSLPAVSPPLPITTPYVPTIIDTTTGKVNTIPCFPGAHFSFITIQNTQPYTSTFSGVDLVPYANDGYIQTTSSTDITILKSGVYAFHMSNIVSADPLTPLEFKILMYVNGSGYENSYVYMGTSVVGSLINKSVTPTYFASLLAGNIVRFDMACSTTVTMGLGNIKCVYMYGEQSSV